MFNLEDRVKSFWIWRGLTVVEEDVWVSLFVLMDHDDLSKVMSFNMEPLPMRSLISVPVSMAR